MDNCKFCCVNITEQGNQQFFDVQKISNFHFYQLNSTGVLPKSQLTSPQIAQFSFLLAVSHNIKMELIESLAVCLNFNCWEKLEQLDNLHQQLLQIKTAISYKVSWLSKQFNKHSKSHLATPSAPTLSVNGTVTGKQGITTTIKYLQALCSTIPDEETSKPSTTSSASPSSPEEDPWETDETPITINCKPIVLVKEEVNAYNDDDQPFPPESPEDPLGSDSPSNDPSNFVTTTTTNSPQSITQLNSRLRTCPICQFPVCLGQYNSHVNSHQVKVTNEEMGNQCPVCHKIFATKLNLKIHQRNQQAHKFACESCGEKFANARLYNLHKRMHIKEELTVKCPLCETWGRDQEEITKHMKTRHKENSF